MARLMAVQEGAQRGDPVATADWGTKDQSCPDTAVDQCFDSHFPCERCCDTRFGAQGNPYCWTQVPNLRPLSYEFCCGTQIPFTDHDIMLHFERACLGTTVTAEY
jgi:hypothetical protein